MSSFSSVSARKAARRRVEVLARHKSPASSCLKVNTVLSGLMSLVIMLGTLLITGATTSRVAKHEASIISALDLARVTEFSSIVVHSVASAAEAQRLQAANATASSPSVLDVAYGDAFATYAAWPSTSANASIWRLREAPSLLFSSAQTMITAARDANPAEYAILTEPDYLCVFKESPDEHVEPGHFPLQLTRVDVSHSIASSSGHGAAATAAYRNSANCSNTAMSISDTVDAAVTHMERLRDSNVSSLSPRDFSVRFIIENGEAVLSQAVNDTVEGAIVAMVADLANVLDVQLLILFCVAAAFLVVQLCASVSCARLLASEQRVILKVLFSMPKPIAKAVNAAAVQHYRDLKLRRAAFNSPEGRTEDEGQAEHQLHSDDSATDSDERMTMPAKSIASGSGAGAGGRGTMRYAIADGDARLLDSGAVESGDRAALATAVAFSAVSRPGAPGSAMGVSGRWTKGHGATPVGMRLGMSRAGGLPRQQSSGSDAGSDVGSAGVTQGAKAVGKPVGVTVAASSSRRPFSGQAAAAVVTAGSTQSGVELVTPRSDDQSPTGPDGALLGDATGLRGAGLDSERERRGSMQSLTSFAEQTAPGASRAAARQADARQARQSERKVRVTDKGHYVLRAGLCTVLPTLLVMCWFVSVILIEAVLHNTVVKDVERVTHALELSVWVSKHAHSFAWAVVDPSTQSPGSEATRAALLERFAEERDSIELRMGLLVHGGRSSLEAAIDDSVEHGWLDALSRSESLPPADPARRTFAVLTADACPAVLGAASRSYFNSGGRTLISPSLCSTVHDGVLARGLTTAVSRLLSRSRSLESAVVRLWGAQARLRLLRSDPAAAAAALVNATAEEAIVLDAHAASAALFRNLLQLVDPWLRLAAADLGLFLAEDLKERVIGTWTLQRDITIISGTVVVITIILVIAYALDNVQAAVRSARRLLHFLPESAYKQPAVAEALNNAFTSIGMHMMV